MHDDASMVYGWSELLADVTIAMDRRGVQRRGVHNAEDMRQVAAACEQLLAALGVDGDYSAGG
jgi:hypothetical protein